MPVNINLNANLDINKFVNDIAKSIGGIFKNIKEEKDSRHKTLVQFNKELYTALDTMSGMYRSGKLRGVKVNDKALKSQLGKVNTAAMEQVLDYQKRFAKHFSKKNLAFFDKLAIALHKIGELKRLSGLSDRELALRQAVRVNVRAGYIVRALLALR